MAKKTTSAGIVITDGELLLLGHVTNNSHWDIPKGQVESNESMLHAAVRECAEETGLQVPPQQLQVLGLYDYKPTKDLMLYLWCVKQMPDPLSLHCKSMFVGAKGREQPELDKFACVSWDQIGTTCRPDLVKVLKILEKKARDTARKHKLT